jgi:hypothetical protein
MQVSVLVSIASPSTPCVHLALEWTALFVHGCIHNGDVVVEMDFYIAVDEEEVPVYCLLIVRMVVRRMKGVDWEE